MREKELRRSMSVFPIGTVMKLTDLTARQMLEIKDYLSDGLNMAGIKRVYEMKVAKEKEAKNKPPLTDEDVRRIFYDELLAQGGLNQQQPYQQKGPRM